MRIVRTRVYRALVALVVLSLTLTGCVTTPITEGGGAVQTNLTPAEQRLRKQSSGIDVKTSIQGCLAGAAVGTLVGALVGGGDRNKRMLVGAAVGCAAGLTANAYVQSKRQRYQDSEQRIAAMTTELRAENARYAELVSTSQEVIDADRKTLAKLKSNIKKKTISNEEARRELARVQDNRDSMRNALGTLNKKKQHWQEIAEMERQSGANTAQLDKEIKTLQKRISGLEKEVALMDRQINATPVAA
jgi:outer membrane lipoprotein SlyB